MLSLDQKEVSYSDGKTIHYVAAGPATGPLIVFMHGWPGIGKTWQHQLIGLASLGFRVVAPDMPGYGQSTAARQHADYTQEAIVKGMLAILADTGNKSAVWIGHDWGCGTLWTLANTHPQVCRAVVGICVPYRALELGLGELTRTVNRDIYPEADYPYGQWSYQKYYEESFQQATDWMERDIRGFLKALFQTPKAVDRTKPARTSTVLRDGGWFGGIEKPPPEAALPDDICMSPELFQEVASAMEKTGFFPGNSWYMHHEENHKYNTEMSANDGRLDMPVLFIHATKDLVCDTITSSLAEEMREKCSALTEATIDSGHFLPLEKPALLMSELVRWMVKSVPDWWPGDYSA
ncbi:hypothetical protein NQ176_g5879 [Zarea fungicola]|uniref:Uncharacterized protein n=1 Tax=Zarea fungicola TaxID=93591 RepID=A0ACC1N656_9HYPO|nr:hypothetical protein NQ176_g5879 [Lecanicillium fungicola]